MSDRIRSIETRYGQITPPDDNYKSDWTLTTDPDPRIPTLSAPHHPSEDSSSSATQLSPSSTKKRGQGVEKKDKYREKNRVAAAKCRAKKKEHTDGLEETHRTQSMLNSLLKQTEQNLRDELSFWRTQALQHAYCDCVAVQEYNMRKAKALAANKDFGAGAGLSADPGPGSEEGGSDLRGVTSEADPNEPFYALQGSAPDF